MKLAALILSLVNVLVGSFVFMKEWNWFPHVSLGVPELSFVGAVGIFIMLIFFKNINISKKDVKVDDEDSLHRNGTLFFMYWTVLGMGYVVNLFM